MDKHIFYNGRIFTSNPEQPYAEAMVVEAGKIIWIGSNKDIKETAAACTDLKGKRVLPGFVDAHMHPLFLANAVKQIACTPPAVNSIDEMLQKVMEKRACSPDNGSWIEGWGYDENKLSEGRSPNRWDLDKASPDVPVFIMRTCFHIAVVNSRALQLAGINKDTPDPAGGKIDRDENGEPTGILRECAKDLVYSMIPKPTMDVSADNLALLSTILLSQGITSMAECLAETTPEDYYNIYIKAAEKGLKQRVVLYYQWDQLKKSGRLPVDKRNPENRIFIGGIKIMADGSISGKTAWIDPPYFKDENNYGLQTITCDELLKAADYAEKNQLQISVHAMGEQAIDLVVNTLYVKNCWLTDKPCIRIDHAAMPTDSAIRKSSEKGFFFVSQPIFIYAEIESYLKNLGLIRTKKTYPYKHILQSGVKLAFSSDAPATAWSDPSNPFTAIKAAVTRVSYDGTDNGRENALDVETAICLYTREATEACGIKGTGILKPGCYADFIILDQDILEIGPEEIDSINVSETYINGALVYKNLK